MRQEGFVSASIVCAQYGVTRAQLLDAVLQGKIKPQKPDNSAVFYCHWQDCIKYFGTPAEYRAKPTRPAILDDINEPEILLDGMIPIPDLEDLYRKEAAEKAAQRKATKAATPAAEKPRVVIRPADFSDSDLNA
jgi:hypothetical protein